MMTELDTPGPAGDLRRGTDLTSSPEPGYARGSDRNRVSVRLNVGISEWGIQVSRRA
jgi:hypothetical protein